MEAFLVSLLCAYIIHQNQRLDEKLVKMDERHDKIEIRLTKLEIGQPKRRTDWLGRD